MATAAQIAANRWNALKSTGPRTARGKAKSNRNALRHGLTARRPEVSEDAEEFGRLHAEMRAAVAPQDGREERLAEAMAHAVWRLRRAARAEAALFNRAKPWFKAFDHELALIQRYEATAQRTVERALMMLERHEGRGQNDFAKRSQFARDAFAGIATIDPLNASRPPT